MKLTFKHLAPISFVFISFAIVVILLSGFLTHNHIDSTVLLCANGFFYFISILSLLIQLKGLHNKNPNVFIRSVMASMMLKMFLCITLTILYVILSGDSFNKRAVFISLFLYLIYLAVEVYTSMMMNKKSNG